MRAIHKVRLDKVRPAVILTREPALHVLNRITVAPITSTIRGLQTEIPVGRANGLDHDSVITVDNILCIPRHDIGDFIGLLSERDEYNLTAAIHAAFDLR